MHAIWGEDVGLIEGASEVGLRLGEGVGETLGLDVMGLEVGKVVKVGDKVEGDSVVGLGVLQTTPPWSTE